MMASPLRTLGSRSAFWLLFWAALAACGSTQSSRRVSTQGLSQREAPAAVARPLQGTRIVVDAGHGGKDPGASAVDGTHEKDHNLRIAHVIAAQLRSAGAEVLMTRSGDEFISLDDRARLADRTHCDLFLSIHSDAAGNSEARGATVYRARGALAASCKLGRELQQALTNAGFHHRGVKEAGFRVLVGHSRPSLLLECGFLTNAQDTANLGDARWRDRLSGAVCQGVIAALGS